MKRKQNKYVNWTLLKRKTWVHMEYFSYPSKFSKVSRDYYRFFTLYEWSSVVHLRRLILSHNHLSCVPSEICSLIHLNYLDVSDNPLVLEDNLYDEPCFPQEFNHLTNLQTLIATDCNLNDIPAVIWSTTSLLKLNLSGNKVRYIAGEIGKLKNVRLRLKTNSACA